MISKTEFYTFKIQTNSTNMKVLKLTILFSLISTVLIAQEINQASVFYRNQGSNKVWFHYKNNHEALYKIITNEAYSLLDERKQKIENFSSSDEWEKHRKDLKSKIFQSINNFEKTPLKAKITGIIEKERFTVEKVLFESHPGFYVTGCLFIPKERQNPAPAVIYCSGHTELAFRSETYQHVILNLVEKGFIVFGLDPIGQGERLQYLNKETGKSKVGSSTKEHTYAGVQTLLSGTSLTDYFIWDGVRTVDYLLTRKEIDAKRIGITGRSGGGTQSSQIAAFDDRIYACAPECYLTTFERLLQSIGPQDAEQNPYRAIKRGFDHPDYLHLRAPKPSLIITTTHDFFSQQGARECFAEVQKSYSAFGKQENVEYVEDYGKHESTKKNREALYDFFQRHLNNPGNRADQQVDTFKVEELWVTKTGQLQSSVKGKTVFDLNQNYYKKENLSENALKRKIQELAGVEFKRKFTTEVYTGVYFKDDLLVEKYFLENSEKDYVLPVYHIKKKGTTSDKILIWLDSDGKEKLLENNNLKSVLDKGYSVISADLPGIGELFDKEFTGDGFIQGIPFNYTFGAHLVGKSISGIRTESIDLLVQYVVKTNQSNQKVYVLVEGDACTPMLHYSLLKNSFEKTAYNWSVFANKELIKAEYYDPAKAFSVIPGSLSFFDNVDLLNLLPEGSSKSFENDLDFQNILEFFDN